jgi:phage-related protein
LAGERDPMTWTVETLRSVVDAEIAALPKDIQAAFLRLSERIVAVGLERIGQPHVKHLRGKLWEMRLSGRDGIGRAIYVTATGRRVIVVHAFEKKTQKTPRTALELAEQRAKEIKS